MKLKKIIQFEKYESPIDYDDDESYQDYGFDNHDDDDDDYGDENEDVQHLMDLLKSFFLNQGVEVDVENKGFDLTVYTFLKKVDKLKNIIKIFNIVKRVKKDILPQYDSEFELWETKDGSPVLYFRFYYEGEIENEYPF